MVKERFDFDGCRQAYRNSLHRLMKEKVDVFIGKHVWNNNTLWNKFLTFCEKRLDEIALKDK